MLVSNGDGKETIPSGAHFPCQLDGRLANSIED